MIHHTTPPSAITTSIATIVCWPSVNLPPTKKLFDLRASNPLFFKPRDAVKQVLLPVPCFMQTLFGVSDEGFP
jgi:hypothetical protein